MERLTGLDAAFLYLENPTNHMHVAMTMVVDPSTVPGGYSFENLKEFIRGRIHLVPPFRRRLVEVPLNLDPQQVKQAETQLAVVDSVVTAPLPETYQWLLVPEQADPLAKVALRPVKVTGSDSLAVRAGAKLRNEEHLIIKFGNFDQLDYIRQRLGSG